MSRSTRSRRARTCGIGLAFATASALGVMVPASGTAAVTGAAVPDLPSLYTVGDAPTLTYLAGDGSAPVTVARTGTRGQDVAADPRTGDVYVATSFSILAVSQNGDVESIYESQEPVTGVAVSPTGEVVATEGQKLVRVDRDEGITTARLRFDTSGVAVGDDGTIYVGDFLGQTVWVLGPEGGTSTRGSDLSSVTGVAVADDGDVLVASQNGNGSKVFRVSPDGEQTVVGSIPDEAFGVEVDTDDNVYATSQSGVLTRFPADGSPSTVVARGPRYGFGVTLAELFVRAGVDSARPINAAGWYRTPVTVTYTCGAGTAPLVCPEGFTRGNTRPDFEVTRTVTDAEGDTVENRLLLQVDTTAPKLSTSRAGKEPYGPQARPITCTAADTISGVNGRCTVTYGRIVEGPSGRTTRSWTAKATDVAGNTTRASGSFRVKG